MEVVSYMALISLSFIGYSVGAVGRAGKYAELKPQVIDLVLILLIWTAAISSKIILDLNRWLLVLAFIVMSGLIGMLVVWPRKTHEQEAANFEEPGYAPGNIFKRLWRSWKDFSVRIGSFQTRITFSFCFFILVFLIALVLKLFSDPLNIKYRNNDTYWIPKIKIVSDMEQFRKQF